MKDSDVIILKEPKLNLADHFYVPQVLKGLGTTMKHLWNTARPEFLGGIDRVIQYPEERRDDTPVDQGGMLHQTYRGVHRLNKDEEGRVKCVACFMCSTACPAHCIHIEADVARFAGKVTPAKPSATSDQSGETVSTEPFTSRRDRFVADLRARVDAMNKAMDGVKSTGAQHTEVEDVRARVQKLGDDVDRLRTASADDWWDVTKARVTEYVERVEQSVDRLNDNKG